MVTPARADEELIVGRYVLSGEVAKGGIASVHFGRLHGAGGFARTFAIKRLRPEYANDPDFVSMFIDEARLASRVSHPNVVSIIDVANVGEELFLVMEYVVGESFSRLLNAARKANEKVPEKIIAAVLGGALRGLHAAHEATDENGAPLQIVHRDVSPQNILVGVDGIARVLDFGIAKAASRLTSTRDGQMKGKLGYMAPEQVRYGRADRRTDVYAAGVVLWEALTGGRRVTTDNVLEAYKQVMDGDESPPSRRAKSVSPLLDAVTMRALEVDPELRYKDALTFATALERAAGVSTASDVGAWVRRLAADALARRAAMVSAIEKKAPASRPKEPVAEEIDEPMFDDQETTNLGEHVVDAMTSDEKSELKDGTRKIDSAPRSSERRGKGGTIPPVSARSPELPPMPAPPTLPTPELPPLPVDAPEWMRRVRAMTWTMEMALTQGSPVPAIARAISRAWNAWSLTGASSHQIATLLQAIDHVGRELRARPHTRENEEAGVRALSLALPIDRRASLSSQRLLHTVRMLREAHDVPTARRSAVILLLGWDERARAWMNEAIDAAERGE